MESAMAQRSFPPTIRSALNRLPSTAPFPSPPSLPSSRFVVAVDPGFCLSTTHAHACAIAHSRTHALTHARQPGLHATPLPSSLFPLPSFLFPLQVTEFVTEVGKSKAASDHVLRLRDDTTHDAKLDDIPPPRPEPELDIELKNVRSSVGVRVCACLCVKTVGGRAC